MLQTIKRLSRQASVYGLGELLTRGVAFVLIPIYTRFLTPADYGVLAIVDAISSVLMPLFGLGLAGAVVRFYFDFDDDERKGYLGTISLGWIMLALVLVVLLDRFGKSLSAPFFSKMAFSPYLRLGVWIAFLRAFGLIPLNLLRAQEQPARYRALTFLSFLVGTSAIIYFVVFRREGALGSLKGQFIANLVFAIVYSAFVAFNIRLQFSWSQFYASLGFGLPLVPHRLAQWALNLSDRLLLERYVELNAIGLYSLSYKVVTVMGLVTSSINNAWVPIYYRIAKEGRRDTLARLSTYYAVLVIGLGLGLALLSKEVIIILASSEFHEAYRMAPIIVAGYVMHGFYLVLVSSLFYANRSSLVAVATVASGAVNIFLNLWLMPRYGVMAAAWNTLMGYTVYFILVYVMSMRIYPLPYEYKRVALALGVAVGLFLLGYAVVDFPSLAVNVALKLVIIALFLLVLFGLGFFTPDEMAAARRVGRSLVDRLGI